MDYLAPAYSNVLVDMSCGSGLFTRRWGGGAACGSKAFGVGSGGGQAEERGRVRGIGLSR